MLTPTLRLVPVVFALAALVGQRPLPGQEETRSTVPPERIQNLAAFARLYGLVRFFHPSDEALGADWEQVALDGAAAVETAPTADDLQAALERVFSPLAPTLRVFRSFEHPPAPTADLLTPPKQGRVVTWLHRGVGLSTQPGVYSSRRVTDGEAWLGNPYEIWQRAPIDQVRGKSVVLSGDLSATAGKASLKFGAVTAQGYTEEVGPGATVPTWATHLLATTVPETATEAWIGVSFQGNGPMRVAALTLRAEGTDVALANATFTEGPLDGPARGWELSHVEGYASTVAEDSGVRHLRVEGQGIVPVAVSPPADRLVAELGRGLSVALPTSLFTDGEATLPKRGPAPTASSPSEPEVRTRRLAGVIIAWNVLRHFSSYPDEVEDWDRALEDALHGATEARDEQGFARSLRDLVAQLDDGHARVIEPTTQQGWLPLTLDWIDNVLVVTDTSPKHREIATGDVITEIAGQAPADYLLTLTREVSGATPEWKLRQALRGLHSRPVGTTLHLAVNGHPTELTYSEEVELDYSRSHRHDSIRDLAPGVVYLDLSRTSDNDLAAAMPRIVAADGLVFDARRYPRPSKELLGHLSPQPLRSAEWLIPAKTRPDRGTVYERSAWSLPPIEPRWKAPAVFLIGPETISYGESLMGIVEAYGLGTLVGSSTAGTNGNVNILGIPGGYRILWTGMKVLKHDGSRHHGVGITPDVWACPTAAGVRTGVDEVLEHGSGVLRGLMSGSAPARQTGAGRLVCASLTPRPKPDLGRP